MSVAISTGHKQVNRDSPPLQLVIWNRLMDVSVMSTFLGKSRLSQPPTAREPTTVTFNTSPQVFPKRPRTFPMCPHSLLHNPSTLSRFSPHSGESDAVMTVPGALSHSLSRGGYVKALSKITGQRLCRTHQRWFIKWDIPTSVGNLAAMNGKQFFDTLLNKGAAPPQYTSHGAGPSTSTSDDHSAPPPYHLEEVRFPIGGKVPKESLVTPSQLKTHLGLLRAFRELKTRVTDLEANQDVRNKLPPLALALRPEERWTWFSELALERCVLCDPWTRSVLMDFGFVGSIAGFPSYIRFASQAALFITLPWMCGSSGMRIC